MAVGPLVVALLWVTGWVGGWCIRLLTSHRDSDADKLRVPYSLSCKVVEHRSYVGQVVSVCAPTCTVLGADS